METTLVPFPNLPGCVQQCGPLWDVNGKCAPANGAGGGPDNIANCFCADDRLKPLLTATTGVCPPSVCNLAGEQAAIGSLQGWYTSFCANRAAPTTSSSNSAAPTSGGSSGNRNNQGGGTWLSGHWQWVVFIVVMVIGIAGIWIGACIWRRRYLRKRDRQYALGKIAARGSVGASSVHMPQAGMFAPASISTANVYDTGAEKPHSERKKWNVGSRT